MKELFMILAPTIALSFIIVLLVIWIEKLEKRIEKLEKKNQ